MSAARVLELVRRQEVRAWLYRVLTAAGAIAAGYGLLSGEELALWTGFVAVLFAVPAVNTPVHPAGRHRGDYPPEHGIPGQRGPSE